MKEDARNNNYLSAMVFPFPFRTMETKFARIWREKNNNSSNFFPRLRRRRLMMISKNREETFPFSLLFFREIKKFFLKQKGLKGHQGLKQQQY